MPINAQRQEPLEEPLTVENHLVNSRIDLGKYRISGSGLENTRFCDRYVNEELQIIIRFGRRNGSDFVALLQQFDTRSCGVKSSHPQRKRLTGMTDSKGPLHLGKLALGRGLCDDCKTQPERFPVLTSIVQSTQEPERIITSLVWLGSPNNLYRLLGHAFYFSSRTLITVPIDSIRVENWKSRLGRRLLPVGSHQRVNKIVESASITLQRFAKDDGKSTRNYDRTGDIVRDISRLWVALGLDYVWVGFVKPSQSGLEVKEVLLGPIVCV